MPTPDELSRILAGLSDADKDELLALLEEKDREEADRPVDITPNISDLLADAVRQCANRTDDPTAFIAAYEAHEEARRRHWKRFRAGKEKPTSAMEILRVCLADDPDDLEAKRLATEEGFADPFEKAPGPTVNPMGGELGILQRKSSD
jgi:hypothetical protein